MGYQLSYISKLPPNYGQDCSVVSYIYLIWVGHNGSWSCGGYRIANWSCRVKQQQFNSYLFKVCTYSVLKKKGEGYISRELFLISFFFKEMKALVYFSSNYISDKHYTESTECGEVWEIYLFKVRNV